MPEALDGRISDGRLTVTFGSTTSASFHIREGEGATIVADNFPTSESCRAFNTLSITGEAGESIKLYLDDATRKLIHEATIEPKPRSTPDARPPT